MDHAPAAPFGGTMASTISGAVVRPVRPDRRALPGRVPQATGSAGKPAMPPAEAGHAAGRSAGSRQPESRLAAGRPPGSRLVQGGLGDPGLIAGAKLRAPVPTVPVVTRPRLTAMISDAAARRVTLICAPAGAGKTVACAHWAAAQQPGSPVAWLNLDPGDQDPVRFWAHFSASIGKTPGLAAALVADMRRACG